jgi:hypothetical protein
MSLLWFRFRWGLNIGPFQEKSDRLCYIRYHFIFVSVGVLGAWWESPHLPHFILFYGDSRKLLIYLHEFLEIHFGVLFLTLLLVAIALFQSLDTNLQIIYPQCRK